MKPLKGFLFKFNKRNRLKRYICKYLSNNKDYDISVENLVEYQVLRKIEDLQKDIKFSDKKSFVLPKGIL